MRARRVNNAIEFSGALDEESKFGELFEEMQAIFQSSKEPVHLNLAHLERGNSIGVLSWIQALERWKIPVVYHQVPTWLVEQFNAVQGFFPPGSRIESFWARFFNVATGDTVPLALRVGFDVPILDDYSRWEFSPSNGDAGTLEPDFMPEIYFSFLTRFGVERNG
jgi:hypothetical protein